MKGDLAGAKNDRDKLRMRCDGLEGLFKVVQKVASYKDLPSESRFLALPRRSSVIIELCFKKNGSLLN